MPHLDRFMRKAMAKLPRDRFSSGREMAEAFKTAASADGIWSEPSTMHPLFEPVSEPMLELRLEGEEARTYDIREGPIAIGRHEACQFVLASPRMSRLHACIYTHRGRVWVADLQSQNGTHYQGRALTSGVPVPVRSGPENSTLKLYDREIDVRILPLA
jgi:hypothetical protein